ncbi:hypothetical protein KUTeg_000493 [Tegillarca granosa]|uniref:SAND domain-containing protein n=1 Tax=Tegillarca granosa TaxID=220873 RepID=A0ABQ9FYR9_TEGGR|nr:hypothetical protein KUTeg_000493 [Tegillarca granosa]
MPRLCIEIEYTFEEADPWEFLKVDNSMSMFMTVTENNQQILTNKNLEDVEYYVTKMQDSGSRVEIKTTSGYRRNAEMGLPDGNVIEVTCGHLVGYLHRDRFYCPGIHRECIEVDGEFVSPKKFSVLGDKHRLKDWKNAIRINNRQIRKYIESGELTFWNHDSLCTGRCVARAPAIRPGTGIPVLSDNKEPVTYSFETLTTSSISPAPDMSSQVSLIVPEDIGGAKGDDGDWDTSNDIKPDVKELQAQMLAATKLQSVLSNPRTTVSDMPSTMSKSTNYAYPVCSSSVSSGLNSSEESSDEDDRMLWKGIVELGLGR